MALAALRNEATVGRTLTLAGPSSFTTREVIEMCEDLSDSRAKVTSVPTWLLKATRGVLRGADWAKDAADRLVSWLGDGDAEQVFSAPVPVSAPPNLLLLFDSIGDEDLHPPEITSSVL